jgi:hypothetical protein
MLELQQFDASTDHARVSPRNALVGMTGIGSKSTSLLETLLPPGLADLR